MTVHRRNNGICFGTRHHAVALGRAGVVLVPKAILAEGAPPGLPQPRRSPADVPAPQDFLPVSPNMREWTARGGLLEPE